MLNSKTMAQPVYIYKRLVTGAHATYGSPRRDRTVKMRWPTIPFSAAASDVRHNLATNGPIYRLSHTHGTESHLVIDQELCKNDLRSFCIQETSQVSRRSVTKSRKISEDTLFTTSSGTHRKTIGPWEPCV